MASNFDSFAIENDGSCIYPKESLLPEWSVVLSDSLRETSGLILWDGFVLTHNDDLDSNLYLLDASTGVIAEVIGLEGVVNKSWEDIAQDEDYIYLGDFGNNKDGSRTDLHILRIKKSSLRSSRQIIDTIFYSYSDQGDPQATGPNATDYDCEAMIIMGDSIHLFTKQWISGNSTVYSIPRIPGTYVSRPGVTLPVGGLITGATSVASSGLVVLCGYNILLKPFFYLMYNYSGINFLGGNKRKIEIPLSFCQLEGIASNDGILYWVSNEKFEKSNLGFVNQQLHQFNLGSFVSIESVNEN